MIEFPFSDKNISKKPWFYFIGEITRNLLLKSPPLHFEEKNYGEPQKVIFSFPP
jgi:hypothetical protein